MNTKIQVFRLVFVNLAFSKFSGLLIVKNTNVKTANNSNDNNINIFICNIKKMYIHI
jgi:hypothetical protein